MLQQAPTLPHRSRLRILLSISSKYLHCIDACITFIIRCTRHGGPHEFNEFWYRLFPGLLFPAHDFLLVNGWHDRRLSCGRRWEKARAPRRLSRCVLVPSVVPWERTMPPGSAWKPGWRFQTQFGETKDETLALRPRAG